MVRFASFLFIFAAVLPMLNIKCEESTGDLASLFEPESSELYFNITKFKNRVVEKDRINIIVSILELATQSERGLLIKKGIIRYLMKDFTQKWVENAALELQVYACLTDKDEGLRYLIFNLMDKSFSVFQLRPFVLIYLADKDDSNRSRAMSNVKYYEDRVKILESYIRQNNGIEEFQKSVSEAKDLLKNNFYGEKPGK